MGNRKLWVLALNLAIPLFALAEGLEQPAPASPPPFIPMPVVSTMPPIPSPYRAPSKKELIEGRAALEKSQVAVKELISTVYDEGKERLDQNLGLLLLSKEDQAALRRLITNEPDRALGKLHRIESENAELLHKINRRLDRIEETEYRRDFEARLKLGETNAPNQALIELLKTQLQKLPPPSPASSSVYSDRNWRMHRNRGPGSGHVQ